MNKNHDSTLLSKPNLHTHSLALRLKSEQTHAETILWKCLKANRMDGYHFRRQQPILGFIADFYCHKVKLIIEIDGEIHNHSCLRDTEREKLLENSGFKVIRFSNDDVIYRRYAVISTIREVLSNLSVSTSSIHLPAIGKVRE